MSELYSEHSSDFGGSKSIDEALSGGAAGLTPRSLSRRTGRARIPRAAPAGISDSDFSEGDESPRKRGGGGSGRVSKRTGKYAQVLRDDAGRPLSPTEARRQRKRITNRESARRMRLLRKEEWNNLQQEVHNKTMELQKAHAINRRMNEGYDALEARCAGLERLHGAVVGEVLGLVGHLRESVGRELDNRRVAAFLRNMSALLPPQHAPQQPPPHEPQQELHDSGAPGGPWLLPSDLAGPKAHGGGFPPAGKLGGGPSQIHITATSTAASFDGMHMGRAASAPEPRHELLMAAGMQGLGCDQPASPHSPPAGQHSGPLHPATPAAAPTPREPADKAQMQAGPRAMLVEAAAHAEAMAAGMGLGRFPSVDAQLYSEMAIAAGAEGGLDSQLSIGKLLMDFV